jgi:hypothetical protein
VLFGPHANVQIEGTLPLTLPSGRKVEVKLRLMGFEEWNGAKPDLPRLWSSKGYLNHEGKPLFAELVILRMLEKNGGRRGCWDVFAWRATDFVFAEAKLTDRDKIRESQRAWLDFALQVGLLPSAFLIIECYLM